MIVISLFLFIITICMVAITLLLGTIHHSNLSNALFKPLVTMVTVNSQAVPESPPLQEINFRLSHDICFQCWEAGSLKEMWIRPPACFTCLLSLESTLLELQLDSTTNSLRKYFTVHNYKYILVTTGVEIT